MQDATYDAMKAFQLNTINNKYSSISDSKIRDIEASINTFYNSLGTAMGASGYDKETLKEYIPAIVYTMYDGYYIYGKYFNYNTSEGNQGEYQYGLKPYIYYSCRYKRGQDDFVINYTLDNSITIYGKINGEYTTKSGYVIDQKKVSNIQKDEYGYIISLKYDNSITIEREILEEQLITIDDNGNTTRGTYQYTKYNNQKIYKEGNQYFICANNKKQILTDEGKVIQQGEVTPLMYAKRLTSGGNLYSNSAGEYYAGAKEFSEWLNDNLGNITQNDAVDSNGNKITDFATNIGEAKIFKFDNENDPLVEGSNFNEHRKSVIKRTIQTTLISAIANYNSGSGGTYEFQMPIFTEDDWDKLLNNISISVFMQGMPIKAKYYNNYCIITNNKNEEVVTKASIYILAENENGVVEAHLPGCTYIIDNKTKGAYNVIDFERQTVVIAEGDEVHFYPQAYQKCYNCIVNVGVNYRIDDIIQGSLKSYDKETGEYNKNLNKDISELRKTYLTALARERYDLYRTNGNINI